MKKWAGHLMLLLRTKVIRGIFLIFCRRFCPAGANAGALTKEGARLLDPSGKLTCGIPFCPPEGDAGTGMVATNSVKIRTGNVSAGTSVFAMVVMDGSLSRMHPEIDLVTTPSGAPVAMVHCNNCTSDLNAWVSLFGQVLSCFGCSPTTEELYGTLYRKALEGAADCNSLMAYNYFSGEHVTGFEQGRPLFVRRPESDFTLAKLHAHASLHLSWRVENRAGYFNARRGRNVRQRHRPRRFIQEPGRQGSAFWPLP